MLPRLPSMFARIASLLTMALGLSLSFTVSAQEDDDWMGLDESVEAGESVEEPGVSRRTTSPEQARQLFHQGVDRFHAGDYSGALARFLASRDMLPAWNSTMSAAACLEQLGRLDEALELYEEALTLHDRPEAEAAIQRLGSRVGRLRLSSVVKGAIVVNGRFRGQAPHPSLPLTPGRHEVRVLSPGHLPFETMLEIGPGETKVIEVGLERLVQSGGVRVEDGDGDQIQVLVNGAVVGQTPWEGSLATGSHWVQTLSAVVGSTPVEVVVEAGQTALLQLKTRPLGPRHDIDIVPGTAMLSLDGAPLGRGRWEGWLPEGRYELRGEEDGYYPVSRELVVEGDRYEVRKVDLELRQNPAHPRWPVQLGNQPWIGGVAGWGLGSGFRSSPERYCPDQCKSSPSSTGFLVGVRGGYEFAFPLSLEMTVGAMSLWRTVERRVNETFEHEGMTYRVRYDLEDTLRIRGPLLAGGASYRVSLMENWSLHGRTTIGAWFASSTDTVTGQVGQEPVLIANAGKTVSSVLPIVLPELGIQFRSDPWFFSGGISLLFAPAHGPTLPHGQMGASPGRCTSADPGTPSCAPQSSAIEGERAYGPFWMLLPQVSVNRTF